MLSYEDQDWGDGGSVNSVIKGKEEVVPTNKRKSAKISLLQMKKIKYEDITDGKEKRTKNDLYKPPTVEELNELKETQNLFNNNLFRLQIEELIKEVKIKNKHMSAFTMWYENFKHFTSDLPEFNLLLAEIKVKAKRKSMTLQDKLINRIANETMKCDQNCAIKLAKPETINLFGLFKINALSGPTIQASINIKMPRSYFNVKDFLNNRYFVKRYYYLAYVAHFLEQKELCDEINWICHNNNKLLPVLQIKPKNLKKITVKIFATPTDNYFKPSRFLPDVNNIKTDIFNVGEITETGTTFYNTSIGHDVTLSINNNFIEEHLGELRNVQEAIKLIYIWLIQRELNVGFGAFTSELITYFLVYLVIKKRINKHMSSYQVVRNFWNFVQSTDLVENPISICDDVHPDTFQKFPKKSVVFLDKTGCYNVAAFLNLNLYKKLKCECELAFKLLDNNGGVNSFHSLFITKLPLELQFDLILTVRSDSAFQNLTKLMNDSDRTLYLPHFELFVIDYITRFLQKGLNRRASLIVPLVEANENWPQKPLSRVSFGVNLDQTQAFNFLEMGPALNDPEEREFREFWGELSSDRRFKDGSICVAVYFKTETIKERREIIRKIIDWVIVRKLGLEYKLHFDDFEDVLRNKKVSASYPMGTNEEGCLRVIGSSDELGKKLRALEMPLSITSIQGISDSFSFTEVFPPISTSYYSGKTLTAAMENCIILNENVKKIAGIPRYVQPIESVLQLEHSSKWPKDLQAIRHMKTAFFLEISKLLAKKHKIVSAVKPQYLDVLYEGLLFRFHLYLPREIGLLKKESTQIGVTIYKDSQESRDLEKKLYILPKLMGALKGIQSQYPSYGPSTALIKRWMRAHLIDTSHFPDIVINLLNAGLFLNYSAFMCASTPQVAFLRFLKFFSELQCHIQAVFVSFNDEISPDTMAEIDTKLLQNREAYPNLYIATPYDNCESIFTKVAPSKEILRRVKQLAVETLQVVSGNVWTYEVLDIRGLFKANLEGYHVIIHLNPVMNPLRHEQVQEDDSQGLITLKPFDSEQSNKIPVTDFNPVQLYLRDLRENYGEFALFFHDTYGGNVIGVLWLPKALEQKEFKVNAVDGRRLHEYKLCLNVDALIEDFYILGKGLVKSIDKK